MPRVSLDPSQRKLNYLYTFIKGRIDGKEVKEITLADLIGVTQQGVSYKLKHQTFTVLELIKIFEFLKLDKEDLWQILGEKR